MQKNKFEYTWVQFNDKTDDGWEKVKERLNDQFGNEGWELVSVISEEKNSRCFYFKRAIN
jgi:hypothetical protein